MLLTVAIANQHGWVGNKTPIFFMRDPQKFQDFIHSQKRRPDTNSRDNNMQWDYWTLSPESAHMVTWLIGDRGIPRTWQNMNGYGSHTYLWENAGREKFWVKYHFKTDQGIEFFPDAGAKAMTAEDPDYHLRDLYQAIGDGEHPTWTLKMQIMPFEEAADYRFNPFDVTKVWPHGDYPLVTVGRLVLDRNPENYFAEVEQAAFEPAETVPGIGFSPDKMLLGRLFSYTDTHRYRIGTNYLQLPVQRAEGRGPQLQQGRPDALPAQWRAARLRAQLVRRPARRPSVPRARLVRAGGRDHAHRVHEAPGRRRLRAGRDHVPQGARRCREGAPSTRSSST